MGLGNLFGYDLTAIWSQRMHSLALEQRIDSETLMKMKFIKHPHTKSHSWNLNHQMTWLGREAILPVCWSFFQGYSCSLSWSLNSPVLKKTTLMFHDTTL